MPDLFEDRVQDTTTTTGTGDITLAGSPPTSYISFNTAFGTGTNFFYAIIGGAEWETGRGTLSAATTLVRTTVLNSSNGNALVNFSAGTKAVFNTIPSDFISRLQNGGVKYVATAADGNLVSNGAIIATKGTLLTMTLPATAEVGDIFEIVGKGAGGWRISQNASQYIRLGALVSTTGVGGYVASTNIYDSIYLVCTTANVEFSAIRYVGNITYA